MAIDLGDVRTGLAVGDDITNVVSPAGVIETPLGAADGAELLGALARAADEHLGPGEGELVLGLPINMDGTEGPRVALTRAFGERIAQTLDRPVHHQDERSTTDGAHARMARTGLTHKQKKRRRDALAASIILERFLHDRSNP